MRVHRHASEAPGARKDVPSPVQPSPGRTFRARERTLAFIFMKDGSRCLGSRATTFVLDRQRAAAAGPSRDSRGMTSRREVRGTPRALLAGRPGSCGPSMLV
jgi:hypothetical protein